MHEYSIVQSLVDAVETAVKSKTTPVHRIEVRLGDLSGVDPGLLATAFEVFRAGTCCEGATMTIDRVPVVWECPRCAREIASGAVLRCLSCNEPAQLASGDEIILQRIELEAA
jgi:hydrogenase nickel incorporation protein HypA/HybF